MTRDRVSVTDRVVSAVARELNTDPLELPPLYNVVDGDSLESWVETSEDGELTFSYAGVRVTVYSSGTVEVQESPSPSIDPSNADSKTAGD